MQYQSNLTVLPPSGKVCKSKAPKTPAPALAFKDLLDQGVAVAAVDFRHCHDAAYPAQLLDARRAVGWVRKHGVSLGLDEKRMGCFGHSGGGLSRIGTIPTIYGKLHTNLPAA